MGSHLDYVANARVPGDAGSGKGSSRYPNAKA